MKLVPKGWFTWNSTVQEESRVIAEINLSSWREKGDLIVESVTYIVRREAAMKGGFALESNGSVVAAAERPSAFRRTLTIRHGARQYTLRARSAWKRQFVLLDETREVGSITPDGFLTRRSIIDLPADIPLPLRMFIVWLVVLMWMRASD